MIKYILTAICLCLSMLGLAEFLHTLKIRLLSSGKRGFMCAVLFLRPGFPERQLAFAAEQRLWHGNRFADTVIAVNGGLSAVESAEAQATAKKYGIVYCGASSDLSALLSRYTAY